QRRCKRIGVSMTPRKAVFPCVILLALNIHCKAATPVLTRSYDNGRTGANTSETVFTPAKVALGLVKLYTVDIADDPRIEAQPLYVPGVTAADGTKHNVLYVFSMANHVFAFNADTGKPFWASPAFLGAAFRPPEKFVNGHRTTTIDSFGINIQ